MGYGASHRNPIELPGLRIKPCLCLVLQSRKGEGVI